MNDRVWILESSLDGRKWGAWARFISVLSSTRHVDTRRAITIEQCIEIVRDESEKYGKRHWHWRIKNIETGEVIPEEALGG